MDIGTTHKEQLTVEVTVVKIGTKQITKSFFNQLYIDDIGLWDDQYNILHDMWGKVNDNNIQWIIFRKDNTLRRCHFPFFIKKNFKSDFELESCKKMMKKFQDLNQIFI